MPNILILGATGYLGQSIAAALLRSGTYHIFGHARTTEKATLLAAQEITPLTAPTLTQLFLESALETHKIEILLDVSAAYDSSTQILNATIAVSKSRAAALAAHNAVGPKLGFVYTSGSGVYGSLSGDARVSDLSPVGNPLAAAEPTPYSRGWRPAHEQAILAARDVLDVAVVRPHMLFGRASWVLSTFLEPLAAAKAKATSAAAADSAGTETAAVVTIPADPSARLGLVHVDDAAAGYVAIIDRLDGRLGSWPVFDLLAESVGVEAFVEAARAALGVQARVELTGTAGDPFLELLSMRSASDAGRAASVLGWVPRRREILLDMAVYVAAWEAARGEGGHGMAGK